MITHPSESQLNELTDGTLSPDEHARVASHVATCLACGATVRRIEQVVERAHALSREITPPPESWDTIRAAVRSPASLGRSTLGWRARWPLLAAAAALVIVTAASAMWVLRPDRAGLAPGASQPATPAMLAIFAPVEARYVLAADALETTLEEKRAALDPATIATIERSLSTIDSAIAEARAALARDPANGTISRLLASSYEQKVMLLRRASELTPRS